MGLEKREKISYLKISDGKIRMKTTSDDPEAEERHDDINNRFMYERVYSSVTGYLRGINVQQHDEYGTAYNLIIFDPENGEKYSVTIAESSRYFQSFVMHLPNIDFSQPVKIKPFSFKKDNRQNLGIAFEQGGEKVKNFYKDYNEKTEKAVPKNGLEDFDFSECEDKHDMKIMQTKLLKFLTTELKREIKRLLAFTESNPTLDSKNDSNDSNNSNDNNDQEKEKESTQNKKKSKSEKSSTNEAKKKLSQRDMKKNKNKTDDDELPY